MPKQEKMRFIKRSTPTQLKELAESVREIADRIESGEILAMSYALCLVEDKYEVNWVKASGVSTLELIGAASLVRSELENSLLLESNVEDL